MRKVVTSVLSMTLLSGCVSSPIPAKTHLVGGESQLTSERSDRRPTESRVTITAETVVPTYIIRVEPREERP